MSLSTLKHGVDFIGVGAGALIVNQENEVLLLKRGRKSRNNVGFWSQPGGRVDFGEKIEAAIIREVREETGIEITLLRYLCYTDEFLKKENQHWVAISFLAKISKGSPKIMEKGKHDDIRWFNLKKLPKKLEKTTKDSTKAYLAL